MHILKSFLSKLKAYDLVVVVFYLFLTIINFIYNYDIEHWLIWSLINIAIILLVFKIAYLENKSKSRIWHIIHYWYIAPLILLTFKELYYQIAPIRKQIYDWLFIKIDRWMFGCDPTKYLYHFTSPALTEFLQIIYSMFYFLPVILCLALLRKKRYADLDYAVFLIIYSFYLSYLGYFMLPAIGPRFTLHNFSNINQTLPGIYLTPLLRNLIDFGESIPRGTVNPAAIVQRDAFPSGHTMITLIVMYLSVKMKSRTRFFFIPVGTLLIFSTVYLWYHYVIDLFGGFALMIFAALTGKLIFNWWKRLHGEEEYNFGRSD
jgi:membrane-associated phospholipid phosphatase